MNKLVRCLRCCACYIGGAELQQPHEEVSGNGSLSLTLNVEMADVKIEWLTLFRRTFNGKIPGPTWRVKRGDTVTVEVVKIITIKSV